MFKYLKVWLILCSSSFQSFFVSRVGSVLFLTGKILRFLFFLVFMILLVSKTRVLAGYNIWEAVLFYLTFNLASVFIQNVFNIRAHISFLFLFHKEITDKYFATLERILKVHSETSLITALAHQVNQKDLNNLRTTLLKPFIEEKWRQEEISKGEKTDDNIKSFGQKLVIMRKELHEEMLRNERAGKNIAEFNGKIAILNMIIGDSL